MTTFYDLPLVARFAIAFDRFHGESPVDTLERAAAFMDWCSATRKREVEANQRNHFSTTIKTAVTANFGNHEQMYSGAIQVFELSLQNQYGFLSPEDKAWVKNLL